MPKRSSRRSETSHPIVQDRRADRHRRAVAALRPRGILVRTGASLVSAGTERMVVDFAEKNMLEKARARLTSSAR